MQELHQAASHRFRVHDPTLWLRGACMSFLFWRPQKVTGHDSHGYATMPLV